MGKRLPVTFCVTAVLAVSGCPFDKTPDPKAMRGAAMAAAPAPLAAPALVRVSAEPHHAQRR